MALSLNIGQIDQSGLSKSTGCAGPTPSKPS